MYTGLRTTGLRGVAAGITGPAGQTAVSGIAFDPRSPTEDHAVDAGAAAWAFAAPQPEVTHTERLLLLADSDDAGLEVDAKALLVASDDATAGNFFYEDADRGGTDTPLDGELGLGDDDTVISGIRRRTATILQLNDNNNPAALDIGAYFSAGGAGADLTIYLQTLAGEVSFPATSSFSRVDQVRFTLPADAQTLLDGLEDGDRWIFKAARPEPVAADHAVDADPASWAFATPQPQVTHTADATQDHAVNANAAAWAFALPEPGVTKTGSPTDHAVAAGAAGWTFALPEPEVTRTGPAAADHAVGAGAASWAFALPRANRHRAARFKRKRAGKGSPSRSAGRTCRSIPFR